MFSELSLNHDGVLYPHASMGSSLIYYWLLLWIVGEVYWHVISLLEPSALGAAETSSVISLTVLEGHLFLR